LLARLRRNRLRRRGRRAEIIDDSFKPVECVRTFKFFYGTGGIYDENARNI
jgi:hypothetical protein